MSLLVIYGALLLLTVLATYYIFTQKSRLPLPPCPKGGFISGNLHQMPREEPWKTFVNWSTSFESPIITLRLFTRRTIILNTWKTASDLLESRSKIYSDRPVAWMYHELIGRKLAVFNISSQNSRFPVDRRMLQSSLNPRVVEEYDPLQDKESLTLLKNLQESPESFAKHFRRNAGAVILRVAYGWTVTQDDDYFVDLMDKVFQLGTDVMRPGRWLVDFFPILRFVPSWFPGASFQRQAAVYSKEYGKLESIPHAWAKNEIDTGDFYESFTSRHLSPADGHEVGAEEEDMVEWCSVALYAGGADTTVAALTSFILLMVVFPAMQTRAQAEIDEVVGKDRLPSSEDEPRLPFVCALIKEVLRFAPVAPLGLPHCVLQEDSYLGLRIPKGSGVLANIWAIGRDPELYTDPNTFNPDHFIGEKAELDPRRLVFGFGCRICPGLHFAERSLCINISRILASFDILKALDANGQEVDVKPIWTPAITSHPKPFRCRLVPRRDIASDLA